MILEGARAVGKSRLIDHAVARGWLREVRSFLDPAELSAARSAPRDYVESLPHGTAIDEAQLCESILLPLKERVERARPGDLLLTGSTRLRRDKLGGSDPLAGRVGTPLQLGPLTLGERDGHPIQVIDQLFDGDPTSVPIGAPAMRSDVVEFVQQPALPGLVAVTNDADRSDRAQAYLRQVTTLSSFEGIDTQRLNQLARYLAGRTSTLVNISKFGEEAELARPTVERYLALLEEALVLVRLGGWRRSKDKTETERPKLHFFDPGIACSVARMRPGTHDQDLGRLVETFLVTELLRQAQWLDRPPAGYHWRARGDEVDLLFEDADGRVVCVEVKTSETVTPADFRGIDAFRRAHPDAFHRGFVFHSGTTALPFGDDRWAIPFAALRPAHASEDVRPAETASSVDDVIASLTARRLELASTRESARAAAYRSAAVEQLGALGDSLDGFEAEVRVVGGDVVLFVTPVRPVPPPDATPAHYAPQTRLLSLTLDLDAQLLTAVVDAEPAHWVRSRTLSQELDGRSPSEVVTAALASVVDDVAEHLAVLDET